MVGGTRQSIMGKKLLYTPRSKVRAGIRQIWMRSRERCQALKNAKYCCEICKVKQSKAKGKEQKIEVHHINGVDWEQLIDLFYKKILVDPIKLRVVCPNCHKKIHQGEKGE